MKYGQAPAVHTRRSHRAECSVQDDGRQVLLRIRQGTTMLNLEMPVDLALRVASDLHHRAKDLERRQVLKQGLIVGACQ